MWFEGIINVTRTIPFSSIISNSTKIFGYVNAIHIPKHQKDKLDTKAVKRTKGIQMLFARKERKIFSMDVSFFEIIYFYLSESKAIT